jgi:hypothetical protein
LATNYRRSKVCLFCSGWQQQRDSLPAAHKQRVHPCGPQSCWAVPGAQHLQLLRASQFAASKHCSVLRFHCVLHCCPHACTPPPPACPAALACCVCAALSGEGPGCPCLTLRQPRRPLALMCPCGPPGWRGAASWRSSTAARRHTHRCACNMAQQLRPGARQSDLCCGSSHPT